MSKTWNWIMRSAVRWFVRVVVTVFLRCGYRIRTIGLENIPATGGGILASNHISWIDGLVLMLLSPRPLRMVVHEVNFRSGWIRDLAQIYDAILIGENPKSIARGLQQAREALRRGELVGIFPEGGISRTGQLQGFRRGLTHMCKGSDTPIVPVHIDGLWGSLFSFSERRFFSKWPAPWPLRVTVSYGEPLPPTSSAFRVRQVVQQLGSLAAAQRVARSRNILQRSIRALRRRRSRPALADSLGTELTGGTTLLRALILRRLLRRIGALQNEQRVGVLLPPCVAGSVTNLAISLNRRSVVNLNYSLSLDALRYCVMTAGLKYVVTSQAFRQRFPLELPVQWVILEELRGTLTWRDKFLAFLQAYLFPVWLLERFLGIRSLDPDHEMTTIFTSGSTGMPKGVVLTYGNIGSNVEAICNVIHLVPTDVLIGILPFFHAFGYTVTLWCVLGHDIQGIYHFSPLEAQQIGKLSRRYQATILVTTPTFLRSLVARCDREDFLLLNVVVTGAEQLPLALANSFEQKFGIRPVEGYGTTELSPLVSVNIPPSRQSDGFQPQSREGSVGRPAPGIFASVRQLEAGFELEAGEQGMLYIGGPNVMQGYLHDPEATQKVLTDGRYQTGDLAYIDDDGFLFITGRESRFSKLAGEMVPHGAVEESLLRLVGDDPDAPPRLAVTAVRDEKKGERLVVVHTQLPFPPSQLVERLRQQGLANLWVPNAADFLQVDEIPLLGTGKVNLKAIRDLATNRLGTSAG